MHNCSKCKAAIAPTAHQISKSDFICLPCNRIRQAEWRLKRKELGSPVASTKMPTDYWANYRSQPLEARKRKIRRLTRAALLRGEIDRQPCRDCGSTDSEAHHVTYDTPFNIVWLCRPHHHAEHRALRAKGLAI